MAERTNPHANLIIGAQDEASPVFDKIKASSQSMAAGVEQAATKAAGAVGGIGDKAAPAAQKLDGITASMIRQVQRLNAELEAGGARNAAYFEKMATIKGADAAALAPYLAQLKQAEAAQRVATTGLDQMGMSAKQTAAALRQVPMQFTDIVVSLQGGQSAMQVFLQQGGQLKDMFGGAGNAARALGGYVLGLVNPFTIAAAAVAGIAVAYKQGSAEADGYRMALVMTGNAAGTTAAQMQQMAGRISSVVGTQGAAADALAQMASSGRVASQSLEYFSEVAIKFERTTGTAISETVKRFAELGASPVDASRKLNEEINYLTASIYEQIKALKDQGREADAAALAQNTYADALNNRSAQITQNLGAIEGAWKAIKDAAKSGWDAMLNVGRADSLETQIANVRHKIYQAKGLDPNRRHSLPWDTPLAELEQQLANLTEQERMIRRGAEAQAQRTQAEEDAIAASDALQKTQASGLTNQQKMNKALEEYSRNIEKLKATNPASVLLSPDAIARGEKAIRDQFADKGKGSKAVNKDLADQQRIYAELAGVSSTYHKELAAAQEQRAKGNVSEAQYVAYVNDLIQKQPFAVALAKEEAKAQQTLAKANLDAAQSREKYITSLATGLDKIKADITAQIEATERMGLSKEAIAALDAAKLEMLATDLELQAIKAMDRNLDQQTYDALKAQAQAYRELGKAKKDGAAKEIALDLEKANKDAAKKAQEEWERASEKINDTLTDALMRGFESGKDFAKNLRDTVVNMFKTMVLRPVISAVLSPISGGIQGMMGGMAGGAAGGSNPIGMASNAYSLYNTGSQAWTLGSQYLSGSMSGANALGSVYANATGGGLDALLATNGAYGTAAGAGAGLMSGLSTALPWVGGALAIASLLDNNKGGPKTIGGASDAATIQATVAATLAQFGIKPTGLRVGGFSAADPMGDSLTQLQTALFRGDTALYSRQDRLGGFENVGRSSEELAAAWAEETARITLAALQATLEPKYQQYLREVDANTSSADAINAALARVTTARTLEERLLELSSTEAENLARARARELDAMDETLRPLLRQIQAQEDLKKRIDETNAALLGNVTAAYDALRNARGAEVDQLGNTVTRLRDYGRSLREFRDGLLLGNLSTLTPGQRLEEARRQLENTAQLARGGDVNAQGQVQGLVSAFLEASATYNASGAGFTSDFAYTQQLLTELSTSALAGADVAQLQLDALGVLNQSVLTIPAALTNLAGAITTAIGAGLNPGAASIGALAGGVTGQRVSTGAGSVYASTGGAASLGNIVYTKNGKTFTLQELQNELISAIVGGATSQDFAAASAVTGITRADALAALAGTSYAARLPAFRNGGSHMGGWAMVGEAGPELAYMPPARIYSNGDTRQMLDIAPLKAEIRELRGTVEQLGRALVAATYDATDRAAGKTVDGVAGATSRASFAAQTVPVLA